MVWLKRMISAGVVAIMATVTLVASVHAADQDERELRANRRDRVLPQRQVHKSHEAPPAHAQRLSPEERRQLRRDIKDAGREIYTPPR